jgi:hypothetical protein
MSFKSHSKRHQACQSFTVIWFSVQPLRYAWKQLQRNHEPLSIMSHYASPSRALKSSVANYFNWVSTWSSRISTYRSCQWGNSGHVEFSVARSVVRHGQSWSNWSVVRRGSGVCQAGSSVNWCNLDWVQTVKRMSPPVLLRQKGVR